MADQRMIGDILSERRRSLGLSIDRVVADTKLQRRMVDAFEDSDFDAMPPKGYAQASLASYARYLGLNPNEILRIYDDQLYEHQRSIDAAVRGGVQRDDEYGRRSRSQRQPRSRSFDVEPEERPGSVRRTTGAGRDMGSRGEGRGSTYDSRPGSRDRAGGRPYDRGLYDSGYRRSDSVDRPMGARERSGSYDEAYDRRSSGRRSEEGYRSQRQAPGREGRDFDRSRQGRPADREVSRGRVTQVVTLDDGYQGGSGGPESRNSDTYHPRPARTAAGERQSFSEVALGFLNSMRSDRRTFYVIVGVVALTLVIVLAVAVSSCVRDRGSDGGSSTIPVTSMQGAQTGGDGGTSAPVDNTSLAPSIDLTKLAPGSIVALAVSADATTSPWIEASVDGVGVYASITTPGTNLQWTINQSAVIKLSTIDGVSIYVNGTAVTPTYQNATYELNLSVDPALLPQEPAAGDDDSGDVPDDDYVPEE